MGLLSDGVRSVTTGQAERLTRSRARSVIERDPRPMATVPDCTISRMPNGSRAASRASSLPGPPVASMTTVSGTTSTTCARNSWTTSRTLVRCVVSALTFTSSSSRWTDAASSSSTILMTLISLLSCLVTCSSGRASTSTTTVMREISSCSVGPTASEWMLNDRRANRPATRVSTPGLFSTRTDRVWRLMNSLLAVPRRADAPRVLDLVVADARSDHRPHHRVARHGEVDDHRLVVDLERPLDGRVDVADRLAAQAGAAVGVGHLDEVGDAHGAVPGVEV